MVFAKHVAAAAAVIVVCNGNTHAVNSYDLSTKLLALESVAVGNQTFKNVAVTLNAFSQLSVGSGTPAVDSFEPATNLLTLGTVVAGGTTYVNVRVHADSYNLLSVAGPASIGTQGTPNYSGVSASYLSTLNYYRTQCGLPSLAQNTRLDSAIVGYRGRTSNMTIQDAANVSGYLVPSTVGYVGGNYLTSSTDAAVVGRSQALAAMMEPYGLLTLMRPYSEIGMLATTGSKNGLSDHSVYVMSGNPQSRAITTPLTFPCANTTDIAPGVAAQSVAALSELGTPAAASTRSGWYSINGNTALGTPIVVFAQPGDNLVISSATVTTTGGSIPIQLWDSTKFVGVRTGMYIPANWNSLYSYEGAVVPLVALAPNTSYDVTIAGTVNGVAFTRAFTFRTGVNIS
jgi:hypothetical protein